MKRGEIRTKEVSMADIIAGEIVANSKVGTRVFSNPYYGVLSGRTVPWDAMPEARPKGVEDRNREFSRLMERCRDRRGMYLVKIDIPDTKWAEIRERLRRRKLREHEIRTIIEYLKGKYPKKVIVSGAAFCAAEEQGYTVEPIRELKPPTREGAPAGV